MHLQIQVLHSMLLTNVSNEKMISMTWLHPPVPFKHPNRIFKRFLEFMD